MPKPNQLVHNTVGIFMNKIDKSKYYDNLHKRLGRQFHVYYNAIGVIRSMYWSHGLTVGEMIEKATEKLETKIAPKKVKTWYGVLQFAKRASFQNWIDVLKPADFETEHLELYKDIAKPAR